MGGIPVPKMPMRANVPAKAVETPAKATITFGGIDEQTAGQIVILAGKGGSGKTTAALMKPGGDHSPGRSAPQRLFCPQGLNCRG